MGEGNVLGLPAHGVHTVVSGLLAQRALSGNRFSHRRGRLHFGHEHGGKPPAVTDTGDVAVPLSGSILKSRVPLSYVTSRSPFSL
jgi:hypothetical protein